MSILSSLKTGSTRRAALVPTARLLKRNPYAWCSSQRSPYLP